MKLRIKILFVLIPVILLGFVTVFLPHSGSKRAVENYKRELRAKGEKLTYQELIPATPPQTPNAARVFLNANGIFVYGSNTVSPMPFIAPGLAEVVSQQESLAAEGRTNIWPRLTAEVKANRNSLLSLREILQVPALYYNLDYSQGPNLLLPHLAQLKRAEQLASGSTIVALHERDFTDAWTNLMSSVELVKIYQTEPIEISHLVKIAMARIAMSTTWEALQYKQWNDAQLSELQARWQNMDMFGPVEHAFAMERAIRIDTLNLARKSYAAQMTIFSTGAPRPQPDTLGAMATAVIERYPKYWAWKWTGSYGEELYHMRVLQAVLENCRAVKTTGVFIPALREYDNTITNLNKEVARISKHFLLTPGGDDGIYRKCLIKSADAETGRRLLVTAIALKRYHLLNGTYPSKLQNLIPEFLEKVPIDLMDGEPLRYQVKPNGEFLLYSVGEDGEDNGGDATPTEPASTVNKNWLKGRDAVWPQPATPEEIEAYRTNSPSKSTRAIKK
ncbi:hypothetical protein [Pedosphaera parvula]|uniref:Uncharacterized protein n=1 Tax=Pedosphaera parvula (strain Ellin514) TaxID=320771 RepID=B9XDL2_PEDPL|nr:hypothetical protein [Pedosphaera parvula]EEF62158.1 hypothetical protein Cflav_PD6433 [Pedosphaera parvula Ellin514]